MVWSDAMMSRPRWSLLRLGVAAWLVGVVACSQEAALPTDTVAEAPAAGTQVRPSDAEEARSAAGDARQGGAANADEARRQELLAGHARQTATDDDRRRAETGDADAQAHLAEVYYNGRGVEVDYEEALRWGRLAAEQGNDRGQAMLAVSYFQGRAVELDYDEAARWAMLAAEQDNVTAQVILGTLYRNGHGVEQDFVSAYAWLAIAVSSGNMAGGQMTLEHIAERRLTTEQLAEAEARVRAWNRDRR